MSGIRQIFAVFVYSAALSPLWGQTLTNFDITVTPPSNSVLAAGSTNAVFVTINNFVLFTNVTVVGSFGTTPNIPFLDNGQPPDAAGNDGTFSGTLVAPNTSGATTVTLELVLTGELPPTDPAQTTNTVVTSTNQVPYLVVPPPANDNFANAIKIPAAGGFVTGTNNYATIEPGEPFHAQVVTVASSVWWNWSPAVSANVLIDMAGSSFDPVLAVYTGDALENLAPVAYSTNDPLYSLKAHVNFDAIRGTTYRIAVAGYDASGVGSIQLRIAPGALPDTVGPLLSITNPVSGMVSTTNSVVVSGTAKDPAPDDTGVSQVFLQLNENPPFAAVGTTNWTGRVTLLPGTNLVRAFARDVAGNLGATDQVVIAYLNPTNDDFADAIELIGTTGVVAAINGRATLEPGEPLHCGNDGGRSIWYYWIAPADGTLSLTTTNSDFDTLLDLYSGASLSNLVEVACVDGFDAITQSVLSNQIYHISVDGYGGESGNIRLQYTFTGVTTTQQFVNLTVDQPLGGTVSPGSRTFSVYSTVTLTATPELSYEFVGWTGSVTSTTNPLTITMAQDIEISAVFRVKNYLDSFETGDFSGLPWSTSGAAAWFVETNLAAAGQFASRSGPIGDGQSSSLVLVTNTLAGTGSFDLRVSSEAGFDWLEFWLNGVRLQRWSGELDWQNYRFPVFAGANRFEWRYVKDANYSQGLDAALVDNLYLPVIRTGTNAAVRLMLRRLSDGRAQISLQGQVNQVYRLEASANLQSWASIATNVAGLNVLQFVDPASTNYPVRFYRVLAP
ncbi:MAG: InlB B-repeat-containing protein [Limisphaerales bacterium]